MRKQITGLEKIFREHVSDTGLLSKTYKEHLKFNNQKTNKPI